ncbi:MAG: Bug family tripartite tricarboxylate transporter substrate binding protein, partial [Cohaesibacteraceae bacterium]
PTLAALLSGEVQSVSTCFSDAVDLAKAGEVLIIVVTAEERVDTYAEAPTMVEQGNDTVFVNWRGFFAAPGLPSEQTAAYRAVLEAMYDTSEWEEVRSRNGWVNIHNSGDDFESFLEAQEQVIGDLMRERGFL